MGEICRDLDKYHRSLRIQCWLNKKNSQHTPNIPGDPFNDIKSLILKPNSEWNPPVGPPNLEYVIASKETGLLKSKINVNHSKRNMSRNEVKLLSALSNDKSIVIKKAEKGGAVVIQNRRDYIAEGLRQLNDGKFYQKLDYDRTETHAMNVSKQLVAMTDRGDITKTVRDYLTPHQPGQPRCIFYQRYIRRYDHLQAALSSLQIAAQLNVSQRAGGQTHFTTVPCCRSNQYKKKEHEFLNPDVV